MNDQELTALAHQILPGKLPRGAKVCVVLTLYFRDGFNANRGHVPKSECPCLDYWNRIAWLTGWDEAAKRYD